MVTRLLDCLSSKLLTMAKEELISSIKACEGRVIVSEVIGEEALYKGISNAELAAAFGADLLLLNLYDVYNPQFTNIEPEAEETVPAKIKEFTGRPVGINLEPVAEGVTNKVEISAGRKANSETARRAVEQGVDFLVLTGNPETGVTNQEIIHRIEQVADEVGDEAIIMAGKMHMAGVQEGYLEPELVEKMVQAGANVVLLPIPGTVPGITVEEVGRTVQQIHQAGGLVMNTIGTSQESANQEIVQKLGLNSKLTGADLHHIGDAGYQGIAVPENILAYSTAIRGRRHTHKRMAVSINR